MNKTIAFTRTAKGAARTSLCFWRPVMRALGGKVISVSA